MASDYIGRTAPSASGPPHIGTLYSAWIARQRARQCHGAVWARIDDLDRSRVTNAACETIISTLLAVGYPTHAVVRQSERKELYSGALDSLAEQGVLYRCQCSKARIRSLGRALPNGGYGYDNRCRKHRLEKSEWRQQEGPLRVALSNRPQHVVVDGVRCELSTAEAGDPIVRRQDGVIAYAFASVVDDIDLGITEIVRGRDLRGVLSSQAALFSMLGAPMPSILHHHLWLGDDGKKLSKSSGDGNRFGDHFLSRVLKEFARQQKLTQTCWWLQPDAIWSDEYIMPASPRIPRKNVSHTRTEVHS